MHITRDKFLENNRLKDESIFNCANGKLGVRGCFEEGAPCGTTSIRGTYINGFCESEEIIYNEKLFGFAESKQTIVNLPDAQGIEIYANGKKLCCYDENAKDYSFVLDMKNGRTERSFVYDTSKGIIKVSFVRIASFINQNLFAIKCKIDSVSFNGKIEIVSTLNGDVTNFTVSDDPRVASGDGKMLNVISAENISCDCLKASKVISETINSKRKVEVIAVNELNINNDKATNDFEYKKDGNLLSAVAEFKIKENETVNLTKYAYYHEIQDDKQVYKEIERIVNTGFDALIESQTKFMDNFWNNSRVVIDADDIRQENIDLCLYEMLSSAGTDGNSSVAAKGLSGEGYEGHYFWDCETYIYPFFLVTNPDIAKKLLTYRYNKLPEAKAHAKELSHKKGALYPWRTITGSECSSYFPSGSAQYHINGDIARAFTQYWNCTHDKSFLPEICEVLLETARLWIDVGYFHNNTFRIDCVTGPDEYTCMVNNNYYTNAGAANNLNYASKLIRLLKNEEGYKSFVEKTGLKESELDEFELAAKQMYYPYDESLGIIKQDDSFLNKKKIDLKEIPKSDFPLLLHYHPLWLYRHQVCKQADAVLADYLFGGLDSSTSKKTYDYYEQCTTHDSSLSKCIFGIMATKLGDMVKAKEYFLETLATDIDDCKGNTRDGLHLANMGGAYRMAVGGFAGLEIKEDGLSLFPVLPNGFRSYSFRINYLERKICVSVNEKGTIVSLKDNLNPIDITVYGQKITLTENDTLITRKVKGVLFDLDGVITDTAIYHFEAWKKIADELKVPFDEQRNEQFKGVSRRKCLELLLEWGNIKATDEQFIELLTKKNDYYKELLNELSPRSILPGVLDTIKTLKEKGIKIALFSVSKNTPAILERLQITDVFDEIVCGNDITNSKPHFEGYLLAADRLKVDPRLCAMVEDSKAGIEGAKALSMKTVAIMESNICNADVWITSTSDLGRIISLI